MTEDNPCGRSLPDAPLADERRRRFDVYSKLGDVEFAMSRILPLPDDLAPPITKKDPWPKHEGYWVWIEQILVAYAVLRVGRTTGFFDYAFVEPSARGMGLQRMLIEARLATCREKGLVMAYTYVRKSNPWSKNNFLACGFEVERDDRQGETLTKLIVPKIAREEAAERNEVAARARAERPKKGET